MKITELNIENVMRVKAFSFKPDSDLIVVGGRNEQGKSTILNCINALVGKRGMSEKMLREGEKKGRIEIVTDGDKPLRLKIEFRKGKPEPFKFEVFNADGSEADGTPREILDALYSKVGFDPDSFERMTPKQRIELLRQLDPSLDFSALDSERTEIFSKRTATNRLLKENQGALVNAERYPDAPKEPVDIAGLVATLAEMEALIRANDEVEREAQAARENLSSAEDCVSALEADLAQAKERAVKFQSITQEAFAATQDLADPDIESIRDQLATADETNAEVRANEERTKIAAEGMRLGNEALKMTERITAIDEAKVEAIENSNLAIDGLGLDEDTVTYNGLPFDQASDSARMRISAQIGQMQNPELDVTLIRNGSLFDDEALAQLGKDAEENGRQVWLERVGKGTECSVIIEDGMIEVTEGEPEE